MAPRVIQHLSILVGEVAETAAFIQFIIAMCSQHPFAWLEILPFVLYIDILAPQLTLIC